MEQLLRIFGNEAETTIRVFYLFKKFHSLLAEADAVETLNTNVYFWKLFQASLGTRLFIGLRGLFHHEKNTLSCQYFINQCKLNISDFSTTSLELRKRQIAAYPIIPDYLIEYMKDVIVPQPSDFDDLARLLRTYSKKMNDIHSIASKLFAHALHTDTTKFTQMLSQLTIDDIESSLTSVWTIYRHVRYVYFNGWTPCNTLVTYPY